MKRILLLLFLVLLLGCTENARVKHFGGKMKVTIPKNERLINITWKESQMWVLTQDTISNQFHFREHSSFGIWKGEVTIK